MWKIIAGKKSELVSTWHPDPKLSFTVLRQKQILPLSGSYMEISKFCSLKKFFFVSISFH